MTTSTRTISKKPAYSRAAIYYASLWGALALAANFVAIDLNRRGIDELQWSIISALRSLVIFVFTPLVTRFADRRKARVKILQTVLALNGLTMLLYIVTDGFWGFLFASLMVNLAGAGMMPLGDSIIVRMARQHDIQYGRLRLWGSIGYMIFGIAGGILWDKLGGFEYLYWVGCITTLLVAVIAAGLQEPISEETEETIEENEPAEKKSVFQLLRGDLLLSVFLVVALLRSSAELMFFTFSGVYVDQLTSQAFFTGLMNGGSAVLEIPTMLFVQQWIKKFSIEVVLMTGLIIQALGLGIFAFNLNPWVMFIGATLRNVGFALFFISAVQFVDFRAGPENASTYQGMMSSISWGLAPLVISPLAGWVYQQMGGQWVFIFATITSLAAAVVMAPILVRSRKEVRTANS